MIDQNGIKRAQAGGEIGVNGEFYAGGSFLPNNENRPKQSAPCRHEPTAEEIAAKLAKIAAEEAKLAEFNSWLAGRVEKFSTLLAALEQGDDFGKSLASQLRANGSLSRKQARYAVKSLPRNERGDMQYELTENEQNQYA